MHVPSDSSRNLMVREVLVVCDAVECGYRIVELDTGRFAFVWGNIRAHVGDYLPPEEVAFPLADHGITLWDTYELAKQAYRECAEALQDSGSKAGDEMLARLA